MKDLSAAVLSIVLAVPSSGTAITTASLRTACLLIRLYHLILRCSPSITCASLLAAPGTARIRAYRCGAEGLDVETAIKKYKTHRSMLNIELKFVSE